MRWSSACTSTTLAAHIGLLLITAFSIVVSACARNDHEPATRPEPQPASDAIRTGTDPGPRANNPSVFAEGTVIDHTSLPETILPILGIDLTGLPPNENDQFHHDWFNDLLYFPASTTAERATVKATSPAGREFVHSFALNVVGIDLIMFDAEEGRSAFGVPFSNYAGHPSGEWQLSVTFQDGSSLSGALWLDASPITISSLSFPEPFLDVHRPTYSRRDSFWVFLSNRNAGDTETLAIYKRSSEELVNSPDGPRGYRYVPVHAIEFQVDEHGIWSSEATVTEALPVGDYRFAIVRDGEIADFFGFHRLVIS